MARTKGEARDYYLRIIDEATKKGIDLPQTKNADYRDKFDYFLDTAQKYIAGIVKIPSVFNLTQNPIPNMIGNFQGFDIVQVLPGTDKVFTLTGCKSYYFEMNSVGECEISVNGSVTLTISNFQRNVYTAYRGQTGAAETDTVTFKFIATFPFNIRNTGFYAYPFPTDEDVPSYMPYVSYDMPSNFLEFDSVILKSDERVYRSYIDHKWENNKKVVLNYYDKGSFDIHYYKYPATISPTADDSTVLDIEEKAFELVVLQCAIMATAADNPNLSGWLRNLYVEKAQNVSQQIQPIMNEVQTVYSIM
jgi:hypothetical protein